jgi:DNA-binding transcriptional MerR regulator
MNIGQASEASGVSAKMIRDLGFSLERIRLLLGLWGDPGRSSAEVKALALTHIKELEGKASHLQEMADVLRGLALACDGDGRPDCPIIAGLVTGTNVPACHPGPVPGKPEPPAPRRKARAGH